MSEGMAPRGKNQILMASLVHSVAKTPPPLELKPAPKLLSSPLRIEQPAFEAWSGAWTSQLAVSKVPENPPVLEMLQPALVCRAMLLADWPLTPSMMSISPLLGQSVPSIQKAGHVPQAPAGMCARSRMTRPCWYVFLLAIRTLFRPRPEAVFVESTPMYTCPFSTLYRPELEAVL